MPGDSFLEGAGRGAFLECYRQVSIVAPDGGSGADGSQIRCSSGLDGVGGPQVCIAGSSVVTFSNARSAKRPWLNG